MTVASADQLHSAFAHCRGVTRERARNFYYGLKLLPEPQRSALYAIYAWMRRADDLVDGEAGDQSIPAPERLDAFRAETSRALSGHPPEGDPIWPALAHVAAEFNLQPRHFEDMLAGQFDDTEDHTYETFEDLKTYCYRVASTVGLVCIEIWGYTDPAARTHAIDRGIAFQLTNILRDFREDFAEGRVYLPSDDFAEHGITHHDLIDWTQPERCRAFLLQQVERATTFYDRSAPLDELITPECVPTLWAMTAIYRGLLEKMRTHPERVVSGERIRLSAMEKGLIALRAKWFRTSRPPGAST